jgi:hypothetical protein
MLAVEAPVKKLAVIAGATLAIAAFVHRPHAAERVVQTMTHHRLTLHTETLEHAIYLTVFAEGRMERDVSDLRPLDVMFTGDEREPLRFSTRALIEDGCVWEGREQLVPIDAHSFSYSYDEKIIRCAPDAIPAIKTPRTGIVTVE